jgi:hypothetical protein
MSSTEIGLTQYGPINYQTDFEDEKAKVLDTLTQWHRSGEDSDVNLDQFESMVAVKNTQRILTLSNLPFRKMFASGRAVVGRGSDTVLSNQVASISSCSDQLLADGVRWLEMEHLDYWDGVNQCLFLVYKHRLDEIKDPNYAILVMYRLKARVVNPEQQKVRELSEIAAIVNQLDPIDYAICRGCERGDAIKEIAASIKLSTRSVENHRQRVMDLLGFTRPIEIVKAFVRLEENGLIERQH